LGQIAAGAGVVPSAPAGSWRSNFRLSFAEAPATRSVAPGRHHRRDPRLAHYFSVQPRSSSAMPDRIHPALAASALGAAQPLSATTAADSHARRWPADCSSDFWFSHLCHCSHRPTSTAQCRVSIRQSLEATAVGAPETAASKRVPHDARIKRTTVALIATAPLPAPFPAPAYPSPAHLARYRSSVLASPPCAMLCPRWPACAP